MDSESVWSPQLVDKGLVQSIADLYKLQVDKLAKLARGITQASAQRRIEMIASRRQQAEFWQLLLGLGLDAVDEITATAVSARFASVDELSEATVAELSETPRVQTKAAESIRRYFDDPESREFLHRLHQAGLRVAAASPSPPLEQGSTREQEGLSASDDPEQVKRMINTFWLGIAGKKKGQPVLEEKLIGELVGIGTLRSSEDIFSLSAEQLVGRGTGTLGKSSARKILNSIEDSKEAPLASLIFGLGIRYVGERTAELLAKEFRGLDNLADAKLEQLENVEEIGPNIAESIRQFFDADRNKELIERLREVGVRCGESSAREPRTLAGKVFVITGTLDGVSRDVAREQIEALGGKVTAR